MMRCDGFCGQPIADDAPVWRGFLGTILVVNEGSEQKPRLNVFKTHYAEAQDEAIKKDPGVRWRRLRRDLALCDACARFERCFLADDLPSWSEPYPCISCGRAVRFNIARQSFIPHYVTCRAFDCRRAAKIVAQRERRGRVHDLTHDCRCHWYCKPFMPTRTDALYCSSPCRQRAYRLRQHAEARRLIAVNAERVAVVRSGE
jgi:hypothetical protein